MKRLQEYLTKKRKKENEQKLSSIKNKLSSKFFGSQKKSFEDDEVKSASRFALANEEVSELCANNYCQIPTKEYIQEHTKISAIHPTVQNQSRDDYEIHRFTRSHNSSPSGYVCDFIIFVFTAGPRHTFCNVLFSLPLSISEVLSSKISLEPIIKEIVKLSSMITVSKLKWIDTNSNEEMNYYWKNMYTKQATPQEEKEKEDGINESESSCKTSKVATVESQISNGGASSEKEESTKANEKNLQQEKKKRQLDDFAVVVECRRIEWPADTPNRAEVGLESQLRAKRWLKEIVEGEYIAAKAMELTVPLYPGAYWCMETEAEAWEWIKDAVKEKHISLDDRISITEIFSINPDHCFFERLAELQALTKFLIGMFKPVRIFKEISNGEKRIKGWEMFERLKELKENRETIQRVVKRRQDWPMRRAMQKEAERIMEQDRMTWGHSHPSEKSTKC